MAKQIVPVEPTALESAAATARMAAARKPAIVRGWQAVTPEIVSAVRADDTRRIEGITAKLLADLQA